MRVVLLLFFCALNAHAVTIKFQWDPNTETDIAGYKIYSGTTSGSYPNIKDIGNVTTGSIDIPPNTATYITVTAYNTSGLESPYSNEIAYWDMSLDNISFKSLAGGKGILLNWGGGPSFVKGYQLEQGLGFGTNVNWTLPAVLPGNTNTNYIVTSLPRGTNFFRVRAYFNNGQTNDVANEWTGPGVLTPPMSPVLKILVRDDQIIQINQ
jgi:hypothetical protein